jgi:hypothetical protein
MILLQKKLSGSYSEFRAGMKLLVIAASFRKFVPGGVNLFLTDGDPAVPCGQFDGACTIAQDRSQIILFIPLYFGILQPGTYRMSSAVYLQFRIDPGWQDQIDVAILAGCPDLRGFISIELGPDITILGT